MQPADLEGQVAIVTGGASGIGLGIARRLAQAGMAAEGLVESQADELRGTGLRVNAVLPVPGQH